MYSAIPCLIFSEDGYLCDECEVLASLRDKHNVNELRDAFDHSLGSKLSSFKSFCKTPASPENSGYRLYRLNLFGAFNYAFCEKNTLMEAEYTLVYLARDISELYRFMSPSSSGFANTANRIIYELLYLRGKQKHEQTSLTPEAFLTLSRVPYLTEAIFESRRLMPNCDISLSTEHALAHLRTCPMLGDSVILYSVNENVFDSYTDTALISLPLVPYISLLILSVSIASALSCDRNICVTLNELNGSADVLITTHTKRLDGDVSWHSMDDLSCCSHPVDSFSRIAQVIAMISDLDVSYSYSKASDELSIRILIGGEILPGADFKYSDPTESISRLIDDLNTLLGTIN